MFLKQNFLKTGNCAWLILVELVSDWFQPVPYSKVPESRPNPRVQIFPPEYLETNAFYKDGVFGTFVCLVMSQDKNRVVAPPVTQKGRGFDRPQNLMITTTKYQ
jgi:hypothetical protein